jgi:hypothetical protein
MREGYGYDTPDASAFLGYAHEVCRRYNEYQSSVQVIDWLTQQIGQQMAIRVSTSAVMSYPNCGTLVGK